LYGKCRTIQTSKMFDNQTILMSKSLFTTLGFILFLLGILSMVLMVVGVQFSYLTWLDVAGRGIGLLARIVMVVGGAIMIVLARGNFDGR